MLIDTHCHLHSRECYSPERAEECLKNAHANGVEKIICIGTDPNDSLVARDFAISHENVYWTYGIHPEYASQYGIGTVLAREGVANSPEYFQAEPGQNHGLSEAKDSILRGSPTPENSNPRSQTHPVAIGEIGLDYHYEGYNRTAQIHLFEQMLQLARDLRLPVSLHIREAFTDAFAVLNNFPKLHGVVHSFTGNKRELKQALDRGFYIGINGYVTYATPPLPPLDCILLETDAPFLTPVPFRGTINEPGYVKYVAAYLAEKLGVAEKTIVEQTTNHARKLFQI